MPQDYTTSIIIIALGVIFTLFVAVINRFKLKRLVKENKENDHLSYSVKFMGGIYNVYAQKNNAMFEGALKKRWKKRVLFYIAATILLALISVLLQGVL